MALTDYDKDNKKGNRIFGGSGKGAKSARSNSGRAPLKPARGNGGGKLSLKADKENKPKEKPNRYQSERNGSPGLLKMLAPKSLPGLGKPLRWLGGVSLGAFFFLGFGALLVHGYNFFVSSQYFSIKTIEISGNYRLNSREVLDIVKIAPGKNALAVSIDVMEAELSRNPWVSGLSIKRTPA